ncbi:hypothetical protein [Roseimicrobium sp. ORNL1]|uniref:hypothetical protein n=1 Tax=Roseimicrobium sp. ORNL1 TaxID=2711231 RepID=UPI0019802A4F|nr:hypothetical protein [Roseimicrobium sp. ORNL1]
MSIFLLLSLAMVYRSSLIKRDQAAKSQLRIDYHQREEALMRALVASFPAKVVACMKGNYADSTTYSWNAIFADAIQRAAASEAISTSMKQAMGLGANVRQADVGDDNAATVQSWITSLSGQAGRVTPGISSYEDDFTAAGLAGKVPPFLKSTPALEAADENRPVVSPEKVYAEQSAGLLASVTSYPKFNKIDYPNIRFGYAKPGEPFVAKRNWWAFSVRYGEGDVGVTKNYILSLYEVPSQLPIEAATFAEIGQYEGGTAWGANITIEGGIYADSLKMNGAHGASRLAGRESIELDAPLELDGTTVDNDFDAMGVRESMHASAKTNILPVALSANSGRVVFYPIPSGTAFLNKFVGTPTKWDQYKSGAIDCKVTIEALAMVSLDDQTPTSIRVKYKTPSGTTQTTVLTRNSNWPSAVETGGDVIPFQTELTSTGRSCITVSPGLLNAWLLSKGGASVLTNNSLHISVDATADPLTVKALSSPPAEGDMCAIIRKGKDLTSFTKGFSLVGPVRVYIGDDLNEYPLPSVPTDAGFPTGTASYYPPMSIFASELRVGTTQNNRLFEHKGQMGSLQTGSTSAWRPMDMKSGKDDTVHTNDISADLTPLESPAELPPIHQLNWLVVIEEIN